MQGLDSEERIVIGLRLCIVTQLLMNVGPKIEGCKILVVSTQDTTILRQRIVPSFQLDIGLRLPQTEVDIIRILL